MAGGIRARAYIRCAAASDEAAKKMSEATTHFGEKTVRLDEK